MKYWWIPSQIYPHDSRDAPRILDETVLTVATSQGLENWLIIYTAGRETRDTRPFGLNSIVDNLWELYVVTLRSKPHQVFVRSHQYMHYNSRSWRGATSVF